MFFCSPRYGLCNQLMTILNSILLADKYERDLYINNFELDVYSHELSDINEILNIDIINEYLKNNNFKTRIIKNIQENIEQMDGVDYGKLPYLKCIIGNIEENIHKKNLDIGNPVSLDIFYSSNTNDKNFNLLRNIRFSDKYYYMKDLIKEKLNLVNYRCVHLRIEDDAVNCFFNNNCINLTTEEYNTKILNCYKTKLEENTSKTYICSGILSSKNTINCDYYKSLMENNQHLCDKKELGNIIPIDMLKNREVIAIIDYLIALDSDFFIGFFMSSFSILMNIIHKNTDILKF